MTNEKLYELLGDINEKHIKETIEIPAQKEDMKMKHSYINSRYGKKTVLIAVIVALLLCGTAAAAGLLWMKPDVFRNNDGHTLLINQGYVDLPGDAVKTIMDNRLPDRNNNCFLNFKTVAEWQDFFKLPLVLSSHMMPNGSIDSIITGDEEKLRLMVSSMSVDRIDEQTGACLWGGTMQIYAALSEESAKHATTTFKTEGSIKEETLVESTTSTGIPYVIRRIVSGDTGETVQFFLYYGYESVLYEFWITVRVPEDEAMIAEDLKTIADTLQIMVPGE